MSVVNHFGIHIEQVHYNFPYSNMQIGTATGSKSQNKVPLPDQQVALALLLELAVQRGLCLNICLSCSKRNAPDLSHCIFLTLIGTPVYLYTKTYGGKLECPFTMSE